MANKIRSITVVYQAFTDKLENATKKAEGSIGGFNKKIIGTVAGFVAARASISQFRAQLAKLDNLGKLSDRLQIDPNVLRGLDLAATQTGTSFATIEKGIQRLTRTIGEARLGITTGTKALEDLGLSVEDFDGLSVEQQLLKVADIIADIEDPAQKAAAATRLLGRSGAELINLFNGGSEAIREYIKQAEELGGPISREDIKRVEQANDAVDRLQRTFEGTIQQLVIGLAPALEDIADLLVELGNFGKDINLFWKDTQLAIASAAIELDVFLGNLTEAEAEIARVDLFDDIFGEKQSERIKRALDQNTGNLEVEVKTKPTQTFTEAIDFQSSEAFKILNPNAPGSIQSENAAANKNTAQNTQQINDKLNQNKLKVIEKGLGR